MFFGRWCRRCAAHFSAVSDAFDATARVNAARFSAVGGRHHAAYFTSVGAAFCATARVYAARFLAVGVGVMLLIFLPLVPPSTLRQG